MRLNREFIGKSFHYNCSLCVSGGNWRPVPVRHESIYCWRKSQKLIQPDIIHYVYKQMGIFVPKFEGHIQAFHKRDRPKMTYAPMNWNKNSEIDVSNRSLYGVLLDVFGDDGQDMRRRFLDQMDNVMTVRKPKKRLTFGYMSHVVARIGCELVEDGDEERMVESV